MPKYDDLGSWKIFLSLAESRSFSVTAEAFGVEPSTISRTLGTLENSLGQKLIDRSARPLELTPKGLWAVKRIAPIIRSHEKLINEMTEDSTGLEGQIRVSVAPGFATRYLVPMLARFSERYPNITFEIQVGMGAADLKKQKADVAIISNGFIIIIPNKRRGRCILWCKPLYQPQSHPFSFPQRCRK